MRHRVAIECKATRRPVERDDVIAFVGKIRDMPSTIGVFISKSGFQSAARKYLQDHGVLHYGGIDLPHFGSLVASIISPVAFPDESAVGEPFWSLMESKIGRMTGTWRMVADPSDPSRGAFILCYSKPHAQLLHRFGYKGTASVCVRGIQQPTLRFLITIAAKENYNFVIFNPYQEDGNILYIPILKSAQELAKEYSVDDYSDIFKDSPS